jgi:hypothetical protein
MRVSRTSRLEAWVGRAARELEEISWVGAIGMKRYKHERTCTIQQEVEAREVQVSRKLNE